MASPVDPNAVMMTGENSFVRLSVDGGETMSERTSHWRVLWCPAGPGHVLFIEGSLTGGAPRIYADNASVARWLQSNIEIHLYPGFADTELPVIAASFERDGDPRSMITELVQSDEDLIRLTWFDCVEPFVLNMPPGTNDRPTGVFSTFFPARSAQLSMNGEFGEGRPWADTRGDRESSSAAVAWSETWVKPRD